MLACGGDNCRPGARMSHSCIRETILQHTRLSSMFQWHQVTPGSCSQLQQADTLSQVGMPNDSGIIECAKGNVTM